jgi:DNA-binding NarL/FixJ family response regulator
MSASTAVIRVLIADDHAIVREGIRQVLAADDATAFEVVGEASNGREAVLFARALRPDVVILDLSMPELSGLDAAGEIREAVPEASILVLSIHDHEEYVLQSVRAGAQGYLRKDSSPAELRAAVRTVHEGGSVFSAPVARTLSSALRNERRAAELTPRERDVLVAIASGSTNKQIAAQFAISVRTVESHRETLMKKLGVKGAAGLTRFAIEAGLAEKRP